MEVKAEKTKQLFEGKVVSDKMDKTIVVETEQTYIHPKFRKILRKTKYMYLASIVTGSKS